MSEIQGIAAGDTEPSKATPTATPSISALKAWLPLYVKKSDAIIAHLNRILATPAGTDRLLMTICYTTLGASTALSALSTHQLRQTARRIVSLAMSLPPDTKLMVPASVLASTRPAQLAASLRALSSLISDFRIFVRLWGLLDMWAWGRGLVSEPPADRVLRRVEWVQVGVNVAYQYLENGAYLSSKGVLGWSAEGQNAAWLWSSRFWAAHVGLDLYKLFVEESRRRSRAMVGDEFGEKEGEKERARDKEERRHWRRRLVVDLAYAPLTIHWSLEKGLCGDAWVGAFGSIAGIAGLRELWRVTAE